jgi:hypothetical protein
VTSLGDDILKITQVSNIFGYFFPWLRLLINFAKKCIGLHFCAIFGRLFTLSRYFENYPSIQHFWLFFPRLRLRINFAKKCIGLHFCAIFFTNSSGHPAKFIGMYVP